MKNKLKIFSGRSNPELASKIAISAGCKLGVMAIKTFSDGEIWITGSWGSTPYAPAIK